MAIPKIEIPNIDPRSKQEAFTTRPELYTHVDSYLERLEHDRALAA